MDRRVVEAAMNGNETTLIALIHEDPLILHRISLTSFDETPLHIASLYGNLEFVTAILRRIPEFLTKTDYFGRCPLHLACAEGHVEIVKKLFPACPEVAHRRDQDGRTPLELAALNEQVGVLTYLLQENSLLAKMAESDSTILHLCIRHNSIEALKLLVDCWSRDEVINLKDENGNNLLHLAAIHKQIETVKFLLGEVGVGEKWNSINRNGYTAVDVLDCCPRDWRTLELHDILLKYGVRRAKELTNLIQQPSEDTVLFPSNNILYVSQEISNSTVTPMSSSHARKVWKFIKKSWQHNFKIENNWAEKIRGNLLVAATLISTISFQAGLSPPGGVWQDSNDGHTVGTSIIVSRNYEAYFYFIQYNTIALIMSSGIILLMVSGFPLNSKPLVGVLMLAMTLTMVLMLSTYSISVLEVLTPKGMPGVDNYRIYSNFRVALICWDSVFYLAMLLAVARCLVWLLTKVLKIAKGAGSFLKKIKTKDSGSLQCTLGSTMV